MEFSCVVCGETYHKRPSRSSGFCSHKCYCENNKRKTREKRTNPNRFYVYCFLTEDKVPYYVGKGQGKRWRQKGGETEGRIKPSNPDNIIKLKENLTSEEGFFWEKVFISFFGRITEGGTLVNKSSGGSGTSGVSRTGERREKTSQTFHNRRQPYKLLSPEGVLYEGSDPTSFCEEHNLSYPCVRRVIRGLREHHKGWKLG